MLHLRRRALVTFGFVLAFASMRDDAFAQQADTKVTFVPWKVLNPGDQPVAGDVVLYWLPASRDDMRRSPLVTSRPLALYAGQCIGMQVIRPDDAVMIERLGESGKLPAAVLATSSGEIIDRTENQQGGLLAASVERMMRDALTKLDSEADKLLDAAHAQAIAGDRAAAVALLQKVLLERCLFPRKAHAAERALRKLGA